MFLQTLSGTSISAVVDRTNSLTLGCTNTVIT